MRSIIAGVVGGLVAVAIIAGYKDRQSIRRRLTKVINNYRTALADKL